MIYKKDYNQFIKDVREVLTKYDKSISEEKSSLGMGDYTFIIDTPYGKFRVAIWDFKPKQNYMWLFTRIEHPEFVPDRIKSSRSFNKFSGKCNTFASTCDSLLYWLMSYLNDLFSVLEILNQIDIYLPSRYNKKIM